MEILKQPLTQGGLLPMGETRCRESGDVAEGCGTQTSPAQARGFTLHQFSFRHLPDGQQKVLPMAKHWPRNCRRPGSGDAQQ